VTNGSGTVNGVTHIAVACTPTFTVGGTISGLSGSVQLHNGKDDIFTGSNGAFTFPTRVAQGASYNVTIRSQSDLQICTVAHGTDIMGGANVTDVAVACRNKNALTVKLPPLSKATARVQVLVFSGNTLVAGSSALFGGANTGLTLLMKTASATVASMNVSSVGPTADLVDGTYIVVMSIDQSSNGLHAGDPDDLNYVGTATIAGAPATLTLGSADLKSYVAFQPAFNNEALANSNFFCAAHLPGGNVFADFAQRTAFGLVKGRVDAAGNAIPLVGLAVQGTFDVTCLADNANTSVGGVELQPLDLRTMIGVDRGFDAKAEVTNVVFAAPGPVTVPVAGFALVDFSTGTPACTGTRVSGGTGTAGVGQFNGDNNQALLQGAGCTWGTPTVVRKHLTLLPPTGETAANYQFGTPVAIPLFGDDFVIVLPITNISGSAKSGILVANTRLLDSQGNNLFPFGFWQTAGSNCNGSVDGDGCLAPGETGYLLDLFESDYANASSLGIELVDQEGAPGLGAKVIPQTFTVYPGVELRVRATNEGVAAADLSANFAFWVALDETGEATAWDYATGVADHVLPASLLLGTQPPDNSIVFTGPGDYPHSSQLKVYTVFGDGVTATAARAGEPASATSSARPSRLADALRLRREALAAARKAKGISAESPLLESLTPKR
jgi:hypothetical protein